MFSDEVIEKFVTAESITVLTGAGVSAESGVPTFRGEAGLWKTYRPEELATPAAFERDADLVWDWYQYRRELIESVTPNPGHYALAEIEKLAGHFTLITQNVDDLHRLAGSKNILELHGNITRSRCTRCHITIEKDESDLKKNESRCICGGRLRPDVVWFGEQLPERILFDAYTAAENCDLFLTAGTSALVHPAASLPLIARNKGAFVIEINKDTTPLTEKVDASYRGHAGVTLPRILDIIRGSH